MSKRLGNYQRHPMLRAAARPDVGAVTGGAGRRRASRMPARIRTPPATWITGHRLGEQDHREDHRDERLQVRRERRPRRPDPVERAEPEHVRQHERAERRRRRRGATPPRRGPSPGSRSAARRRPRAPAPWRRARARSRGTASSSPSAARSAPSSPPRSRRSRRRAGSRRGRRDLAAAHRAATSATPANETVAPSQKRPLGCSRPSASPNSAAKIGVAPRISADRRGRRALQRVDEAELVRDEQRRRRGQHAAGRAVDPQRALEHERQRDEDRRRRP